MADSPTKRTLDYCRKLGWPVGVVERWVAQARKRFDLFGCIDLVALDGLPGALGIQATTTDHVSHRLAKAVELDDLRAWIGAGNRFEVWGWAKRGPAGKRKLWTLRRVRVSIEDGELVACETEDPDPEPA